MGELQLANRYTCFKKMLAEDQLPKRLANLTGFVKDLFI